MIATKQIKPARLKDDAMRLALLNGMRKFGTQVKKEYEKTVSTWSDKPEFGYEIGLDATGPTLIAGVTGGGKGAEHWRYVNEGTKEHIILPKKKGGYLAFQSGYHAKTSPGLISSKSGGPYGEVVYSKGVIHPGTEAREFDKAIDKIMTPRFKREMEAAMRNAAKASGNGVK